MDRPADLIMPYRCSAQRGGGGTNDVLKQVIVVWLQEPNDLRDQNETDSLCTLRSYLAKMERTKSNSCIQTGNGRTEAKRVRGHTQKLGS